MPPASSYHRSDENLSDFGCDAFTPRDLQNLPSRSWVLSQGLSNTHAVFEVLRARFRAKVAGLVARTRKAFREAFRPRPSLLGGLVVDLSRSRKDLLKENALLRAGMSFWQGQQGLPTGAAGGPPEFVGYCVP